MGIVVCILIKNWDFNKKDKSSVFDVLVLILLFINVYRGPPQTWIFKFEFVGGFYLCLILNLKMISY